MVDVIVERCAGLDVHRDTVVATVRVPGSGKSRRRRLQETRTFGTTIGQLERLSDWLAECEVTRVGMESTGCYWKTVFYALEDRFDCWLVNAKHLRNVPGRKSDVIDSRWCCELVELGLVRPSFVPPPEIRRLRRPSLPSSPRVGCGRRSRSFTTRSTRRSGTSRPGSGLRPQRTPS